MKNEMQELIVEKIMKQFNTGMKVFLIKNMLPDSELRAGNARVKKRKGDNATLIEFDILADGEIVESDYVVI